VLQNCMCCLEGETGSCNETCATCDVDGIKEVSIKFEDTIDVKEEVSIEVEEAIDVKDEIPEAKTFSPTMTEHEVKVIGVSEVVVVATHVFRAFIAPKRKL